MKACKRDFYDTTERALLKAPGACRDCAALCDHHFTDGVYLRTMRLQPGTLALGHRHKTKHFNLLLKGTMTVMTSDGLAATVSAPFGFESGKGVRKIGVAHTEVEFLSVHPNPDNCRDVATLERRLFTKSRAFQAAEKRKELACHP